MGSRYEGEKAISLDTSPPRTPLLPAQTFFQGQWRARLLLTVSDGSSRRPAPPRSFPAIPIPGHGVPYAPGSRTHDAYGCPWAPSRAAFLPAVVEACFLPSPLSRPPPFPPSVAVVTRGLAFPFEHRRSNAFPLPSKIRTTRIAGGLLWPCKGLLPAAPKDAGFHAVQAQCPCRLGYPLKGS